MMSSAHRKQSHSSQAFWDDGTHSLAKFWDIFWFPFDHWLEKVENSQDLIEEGLYQCGFGPSVVKWIISNAVCMQSTTLRKSTSKPVPAPPRIPMLGPCKAPLPVLQAAPVLVQLCSPCASSPCQSSAYAAA
ncbi:hypothetical protein SRHO_G00191740 [Serrasalmus rhombeus]